MSANLLAASLEFDLNTWCRQQLLLVEAALSKWVNDPAATPGAAVLVHAMRYAVLDGGKRLRPLLVLAACEGVQGVPESAMRAACAVELIHAYSLVHDDMPCMDNDVLRRGKPTVHVRFGQAHALLAGDALQALAFEILVPDDESYLPGPVQSRLCRLLAQASGFQGMAGGQAIDLASVGQRLDVDQLHTMHRLKTGALLKASVLMGASCGEASKSTLAALAGYGAAIGLAFQVVDDILDVTADSATLGKTAGKDAAHDKPTFVSLLGLDASRNYATALLNEALDCLEAAQLHHSDALRALAYMVVNRVY